MLQEEFSLYLRRFLFLEVCPGTVIRETCALDVEYMSILIAAHIVSFNLFPTRAGLDSSAAGFSWLGLQSNKL
ncbi:hypothetical protein P8452_30127 [Trifolium repens]|nr:hypothetical protein P8452_30127 [Trifolium repens]